MGLGEKVKGLSQKKKKKPSQIQTTAWGLPEGNEGGGGRRG